MQEALRAREPVAVPEPMEQQQGLVAGTVLEAPVGDLARQANGSKLAAAQKTLGGRVGGAGRGA